MSRYIDADVTLETLKEFLIKTATNNVGYKRDVDEVCKDIADNRLSVWMEYVPTADVVEVVHGEWIKTTIPEWCGTDELHRSIYRDREIVKCSECGNPSPVYNIEFEFCPRCGAKMDGKK